MKAVAKLAPSAGAMELIEIDPPQRKPGEVLVRITAGGICGTDVAIWKWHEAVVGQYAPRFRWWSAMSSPAWSRHRTPGDCRRRRSGRQSAIPAAIAATAAWAAHPVR